jgi:hypothetical protein
MERAVKTRSREQLSGVSLKFSAWILVRKIKDELRRKASISQTILGDKKPRASDAQEAISDLSSGQLFLRINTMAQPHFLSGAQDAFSAGRRVGGAVVGGGRE